MTDTSIISAATIGELAKLNGEAKAAAREQLAKHYSSAEIERAFGAGAKPQDKPGADPAPAPRTMNVANDALDFDQTAKGLAALYKHASPDMQARVLAQAKALGVPAEQVTRGAAVTPEVLSAEERIAAANADPAFRDPNGPPADASAYRLEWPDAAETPIEALAKRNAEYKEAFRAASIPVILAQSLVDAITKTAALYADKDMTPDARELKHREQGGELIRTFGAKGAEEILALASAAYARLPESFRKALDEQNAFHSAKAQVALANIERAYLARAKK